MTVKKENGLGVAGGVSGIVLASTSFIFSWFLAPLYVVGTIASIVLSGIGLKKAIAEGTNKGMSITGLATSIPTLLWCVLWSFALVSAVATTY